MSQYSLKKSGYMTPNEVAELLLVSPITVRQWAQKGLIDAVMTPGGHRRFTRDAIEAFAQTRGLNLKWPGDDDEITRILVVDDDTQLNQFLREFLENQPIPVLTESAINGFDAGVKVESFKPHVILLDLMMPGLDGFEVCQIIKEDPQRANIKIIAMTGYPTSNNLQKIQDAGAATCLNKPLDTKLLLSAIGLVDRRRRSIKH